MELTQFSRTELVLGKQAVERLRDKTVAIFGLGGVGGNACEALARSGVGRFVLVDNDEIALTNINRQLLATLDTVGRDKVDVAEERIHSINPAAVVEKKKVFYLPETAGSFDFSQYDYVVDAIDTVKAKIDIIVRCVECGTPVISAMGCGNKVDPTQLTITDLAKTQNDPLAKVLRRELKKRGILHLKVVYSEELPLPPLYEEECECKTVGDTQRPVPGSTAFVPPVAGILLSSAVVRDLIDFRRENRK